MAMMHHHLIEVAGHFDGLMALRMQCRAHRTIVQTKSFHLSPWSTLSAGYSAHTKPAAAMVIFCDAKNEAKKFACRCSGFERAWSLWGQASWMAHAYILSSVGRALIWATDRWVGPKTSRENKASMKLPKIWSHICDHSCKTVKRHLAPRPNVEVCST